jgi:hypothetical protein
MQYYRCKCGFCTAYGTMSPAPCKVCPKCKSTYAQHPDQHAEALPHHFVTEHVPTDHGPMPRTHCNVCCRTKTELDALGV